MLVEALVATTILAVLFLAWGGPMIVATDGENQADTQTHVISSANQILEWMQRDPAFWSAEYTSGSCPHCWIGYNDTIGVTPPHQCSIVIANASPYCSFNWLAVADPKSGALAHLTVAVYYSGGNHQTERYVVTGLARHLVAWKDAGAP